MPNVEWEVQHDLNTPGGNITFNVPDPGTGYWYQLQPDVYKIVPTLRVVQDNVSQADGSVLHPRYKTGLIATMKVLFQIRKGGVGSKDYTPACEGDLRLMHENLVKALNSIRKLSQNAQRFIWTPTPIPPSGPALSRRMLDFVQCLGWADPAFLDPGCDVTFVLESPLPYAIDFTQQSVALPTTIVNPGTSAYDPVLKVHGGFSNFTITNTSVLDQFGNPLSIVYNSSLPGAQVVNPGHYAEIDCFRGTCFLDGSGADLTAGIDPTLTDFCQPSDGGWLQPGNNVITMSGAPSCDVLWNPAWS